MSVPIFSGPRPLDGSILQVMIKFVTADANQTIFFQVQISNAI